MLRALVALLCLAIAAGTAAQPPAEQAKKPAAKSAPRGAQSKPSVRPAWAELTAEQQRQLRALRSGEREPRWDATIALGRIGADALPVLVDLVAARPLPPGLAGTVLALGADKALKSLRHARLTNGYEVELRKLLAVDLLILDDFCLDQMDPQESRDAYEIISERHRAGSVIVTSNRGPDEWLATFADPLRAQSAIDRFVNNAYDLLIEGESYRSRLKPSFIAAQKELTSSATV